MINVLEVIGTTLEECLEIEQGGADRIELISAPCAGGLTPSIALTKMVIQNTTIPVCVMVRAHEKSFEYSDMDKEVMLEDIREFSRIDVTTIVIGAIKDGKIDSEFMERVNEVKGTMQVVFHRAIEEVSNLEEAFEELKRLHISRVLIGYGLTEEGIDESKINQLKEYQEKYGITVLLGGGINGNNITLVKDFEIHIGSFARTEGQIKSYNIKMIKEEL